MVVHYESNPKIAGFVGKWSLAGRKVRNRKAPTLGRGLGCVTILDEAKLSNSNELQKA